jgi:acetyl esterase/lipase
VKSSNHEAIPANLDSKVKGVWIKGVDESLIRGEVKEMAEFASVKPSRIPGYWYHVEGTPIIGGTLSVDPRERVLYTLHGGAYVVQSAHPDDVTQNITRDVLNHFPKQAQFKRALALEYRLSKGYPLVNSPQNPFPSALLDSLAGYRYLIEEIGIQPSNIVVAGDSAGANLALALIRYLKTTSVLPLPGGLILLSPWADLGTSHSGPNSTMTRNITSDFLGPPEYLVNSLLYCTAAFTAPHPFSICEDNIYISPASLSIPDKVIKGSFEGFPKTMIVSGSGEQLLDSIRTLKRRMEADMGPEKLSYLEVEDAFHDFVAIYWSGPDRIVCLDAIAEWSKKL